MPQQGVDNTYGQEKKNSLLEFYLNYKKDLSDRFNLDAMAGYSYQKFTLSSENRDRNLIGTIDESRTDASELVLASLFGRLNLGFDDRYLLTFTLRNDGTSRFSPDTRWGLFPSAALAVKLIDNEKDYLNNLKLRMGWGITGQQDIGNNYYTYLGTYQASLEGAEYQLGDNFIVTQRPNGYDENITWETTTTYNVGLDFSIVKDRFSGSLDLYRRNTDDLLNNIPVPAGSNLRNRLTTNIGSMTNKGIELSLFANPIIKDKINWELSFNIAYNQNEITNLTSVDDPNYQGVLTGGIAGGVGSNIQIHSVGFAPNSFFVFEQVYDESGQAIIGEFVDRNGDGSINEEDKYRLEKPEADYILGLTNNFSYGNFDFSFAGRANIGNFIYTNVQTDIGYLGRVKDITGSLRNVHQSAVDLGVQNQGDVTFSDHFVVPADFFRLDHITVGYNFHNVIGSYLRLYATVQNALVLTSYDGLDPEVAGGIDNNIYPKPRTIVFGLNVDF